MAPDTDAINNGMIEVRVRSSINTSSEKIRAAMGALKMPAIAPVAPQAIKSTVVLKFSRKSWLIFEPIAAPVDTIGASIPTEPPNPPVNVHAIMDEYIL